jgi:hypothetical protein
MQNDVEITSLFGAHSWEEIDVQHDSFVAEAEAGVARWVAAPRGADWEGPHLLWTAREGKKPYDKPLAKEPGDWEKAVRYGIRDDGSVAIARRFSRTVATGRPEVDTEAIWVTRGGRPVQLLFHHRYWRRADGHEVMVARIAIRLFEDGRQVGVKTWPDPRHGFGGVTIETYAYDDAGRVTEVVSDRRAKNPRNDGRLRLPITYGPDGGIERIEAHDEPPIEDLAPRVVYLRKTAGAARAAIAALETRMPEAITAWAGRVAPPGEPVRALLIVYDLANDALPPALALGTTDDAAARIAAETGAIEDLLDPSQQPILDTAPTELVNDPELRDLMARAEQHWNEKDDQEGPRKLLVAVAKRLAEKDWPRVLPATAPDFAVVAVPLEREPDVLERNLRASVPAALRKRLL